MRRALALAGTTAVFAGLMGASSALAAEPWGFEQVTPPVKGGGTVSYVDTFRASPDGNSFLYTTNAPFVGLEGEGQPQYTRYIGRRGAEKWNNRPLDPPYYPGTGSGVSYNIMSVLRSGFGLDYVFINSPTALTPGATEGGSNFYIRNTRTGEDTLVATHEDFLMGKVLGNPMGSAAIVWVAPDGRGAMFSTAYRLVPGAPENSDNVSKGGALYGWTAENGVEALSVMPDGEIAVASSWASTQESGPRESNARHNALDHVYFGEMIETEFGREIGGVYERTDGETYPVSYSRITGDESDVKKAVVQAVSDNGEHALIETFANTPLTSDTPLGPWESPVIKYLYRYNQSDKSLEYVGLNASYNAPIQMSQDGQTVAFQSEAKLTDDALESEPNLYLWRNGELQLAATLEPTASGIANNGSLRVLSENGRYLSFTTNSPRLATQFDQDNVSPACPVWGSPGPCDHMYVFDSQATGEQLQCASCRADGAPPNGRAGDPITGNGAYLRMDSHVSQNVANDGTTFFTTADGILPEDQNKLEDAYAYKDGDLRLVSRAQMGMASRFLDATYDGKSVFIATDDPIVGTDIDAAVDVYMTREGAGYPFSPVIPIPPCDGLEACRGASPAAPGSAPSGSEFFQGRSNPSTAPGTVKLSKMTTSGAVATLSLKVSAKGKLTASGKGLKKASKATKATKKPAVYKLQVKLDGKAQKALKKSGKLTKKVKVTFKPSEGRASSVTRTLTFKAPSSGKGGK